MCVRNTGKTTKVMGIWKVENLKSMNQSINLFRPSYCKKSLNTDRIVTTHLNISIFICYNGGPATYFVRGSRLKRSVLFYTVFIRSFSFPF